MLLSFLLLLLLLLLLVYNIKELDALACYWREKKKNEEKRSNIKKKKKKKKSIFFVSRDEQRPERPILSTLFVSSFCGFAFLLSHTHAHTNIHNITYIYIRGQERKTFFCRSERERKSRERETFVIYNI